MGGGHHKALMEPEPTITADSAERQVPKVSWVVGALDEGFSADLQITCAPAQPRRKPRNCSLFRQCPRQSSQLFS